MKRLLRLLAAYGAWRARAQGTTRRLRQTVRQAVEEGASALPQRERAAEFRVAAVQMELRPEPDPVAYARHVGSLAGQAAALGASVIVFPEDVASGLLALLPGFTWLAGQAGQASPEDGDASAFLLARYGLKVADLFALLTPAVQSVYTVVFAELARATGAWIVAGTANLLIAGDVRNRAHLFAPDGSLQGVQDKLHLFPYEREWGIAAGDRLHVQEVAGARVAIAVCMDATYFETARLCQQAGVDVMLVPIANPDRYHLWKARRGSWARAQQAPLYAVQAALVGGVAGFELEGKSGVYAPLALTRNGDGVVAEAVSAVSEEVVVADLDLPRLAALKAAWPKERPDNPELFARLFPSVYDRARQ